MQTSITFEQAKNLVSDPETAIICRLTPKAIERVNFEILGAVKNPQNQNLPVYHSRIEEEALDLLDGYGVNYELRPLITKSGRPHIIRLTPEDFYWFMREEPAKIVTPSGDIVSAGISVQAYADRVLAVMETHDCDHSDAEGIVTAQLLESLK